MTILIILSNLNQRFPVKVRNGHPPLNRGIKRVDVCTSKRKDSRQPSSETPAKDRASKNEFEIRVTEGNALSPSIIHSPRFKHGVGRDRSKDGICDVEEIDFG